MNQMKKRKKKKNTKEKQMHKLHTQQITSDIAQNIGAYYIVSALNILNTEHIYENDIELMKYFRLQNIKLCFGMYNRIKSVACI